MKTFYLSFVDPDRPKGSRWLGACIVEAEEAKDALRKAWEVGCNPGGEVLSVEAERPPKDLKWYNRLLNENELLEMGAEIVAENGMSPSENTLVNPHGKVVGRFS